MNNPFITIVTVSFNAVKSIEKTILSVINQSYSNFEYIIIDGGSTDGTLEIIKKYSSSITYWISEPDKGIYDAMNKGINMAKGKWINFMNAGDIFTNNNVLEIIFSKEIPENKKIIYSNFYSQINSKRVYFETSMEKGKILHQSTIYQKNLHNIYGFYQVTKPIIISDFLFFSSIPLDFFYKIDIPISINDAFGVSSQPWCYQQKVCCDFIYNRCDLGSLLYNLIIHKIKTIIKKILGWG